MYKAEKDEEAPANLLANVGHKDTFVIHDRFQL
jgi:hypothetical protein